jgi:hypothetical protein
MVSRSYYFDNAASRRIGMRKITQNIFRLVLVVVALSMFSILSPRDSIAQPQVCGVTLLKEAEGTEGIDFNFLSVVGTNVSPFILTSGIPQEFFYQTTVIVTYTELDSPGWALADVTCDSNDGVNVTYVDNGVTIECLNAGGEAECVWTNIQLIRNIPTLSQWGLIAVAIGLGLVGAFFAVRKRKDRIAT